MGETMQIYTANESLKYIFAQKELNMTQMRWLELMADYDIDLHYHLDKINMVPNALCRKPETFMTV